MNVTRNDADSRYDIHDEGTLLGFAAFQTTPTMVVFTHTEVFPGSEGKGVGGTLVRAALDDVREQGLRVLAICPFVLAYMQKHREYADLDYRAPQSRVDD